MRYGDTLHYLYGLQFFGIKLGLANIRALLKIRGNPHRLYPTIHIAGTNGKGSVSACLASAFTAAGYRTGLYTSPHLVDFSERIRVDGIPIPRPRIIASTNAMRADIERLRATFFEATTAMAFEHFADAGVDIAIIETGLGGRLDATNVVHPSASVITSIDLDHTEYLGPTLRSIAREKAGIIKAGIPVYTAAVQPEALDVLRRTAIRKNAQFREVRRGVKAELLAPGVMRVWLPGAGRESGIRAQLAGMHQSRNIALAYAVYRDLLNTGQFPLLRPGHFSIGLRRLRANTGLRGRMEQIRRKPEIVIDVAHNPAGISALLRTWIALRNPGRTHLIFGMQANKDIRRSIDEIGRFSWKSVTLVAAGAPSACPTPQLWNEARSAGLSASIGRSVAEAVRDRLRAMEPRDSLLLFGSHYVAGEFLAREREFTESYP